MSVASPHNDGTTMIPPQGYALLAGSSRPDEQTPRFFQNALLPSALLPSAFLLTFLLFFGFMEISRGQDFEDDDLPQFLPGLVARYVSESRDAERVDDDILFDWSVEPLDARLGSGRPFQAHWSGYLQAKDDGLFRISVFLRGSATVRLAGAEIVRGSSETPVWLHSEPMELRFGRHAIEIEFQSPAHATADRAPQLKLYWTGPSFPLEPIAPRYWLHDSDEQPDRSFAEGQTLSRGLRCSACHEYGQWQEPLPAPSLTHLQDNLRPDWLIAHLREQAAADDAANAGQRRMPYFQLDPNSASAISAALFHASAISAAPEPIEEQLQALAKNRKKKDPEIRTEADPTEGAIAFASLGCLACHPIRELGATENLDQQMFSGGDLSELATKRTLNFLRRWLVAPQSINANHRMPVFELSLNEQLDLSAYLGSLGSQNSRNDTRASGDHGLGVQLVQKHRCGACHELPASLQSKIPKLPITPSSDWQAGCLTQPEPKRAVPGFALSTAQRMALKTYFTELQTDAPEVGHGQWFAENNCLACHSRDLAAGISVHLPAVATQYPSIAARLAALAPPSLTGVGDKLNDRALSAAITRQSPPLRPWLDVRMPKFNLSDAQVQSLVDRLVAHDRIPLGLTKAEQNLSPKSLAQTAISSETTSDSDPSSVKAAELAAARLVTAEGFGCQSCHAIGDMETPQVDLKAKGTNLAMLGSRIREPWFQRWVRNPSRIVPRMEMPAIQTAAKGVLDDNLERQLEALWHTLNQPDFVPPRANPVRIVRNANQPDADEPSHVLTCVIETPEKNFIRPIVVGLPNRQNFLFDLETGRLTAWWIGDTARQHTRGKSWFWETGAEFLNEGEDYLEQIEIVDSGGTVWNRKLIGQVSVQLDSIRRNAEGSVIWRGRANFGAGNATRLVNMEQLYQVSPDHRDSSTIRTRLELEPGDRVVLKTPRPPVARGSGSKTSCLVQAPHAQTDYQSIQGELSLTGDMQMQLVAAAGQSTVEWASRFSPSLPSDSVSLAVPNPTEHKSRLLDCVPGYEVVQLPLPPNEMPISLAWGPDGQFYTGSLKGRVLKVHDHDHDGLYDTYETISDEFPTPYGLAATEQGVDILTKFAFMRLAPSAAANAPWNATVLADGWGYTADYHDWAVGLERDPAGNYYMALPCQQDDRSEAAAYLRGQAIKLVPNSPLSEAARPYRLEPIAAGLRFPMGIALNQQGELFTTDNQGNYNPFNELNHIRQGKRYGFINKLENKEGFSPPFESPAINLPHPWTRSVNGICFLNTPSAWMESGRDSVFGPFEGHLIGCEMNGRSLVRLSLQKVGEQYQGAAYEFSLPGLDPEDTFEGPIVCELSPDGDLYVGNLHDSGWGGGQNTGSIVRLRPTGSLPLGIAEVRATADGFEIDFTGPVDIEKAKAPAQYQIRSYRRISTPAYGGDDQDERQERIESVLVSADARRVTLALGSLQEEFVYELNIGQVGSGGEPLFPNQAHYTMRSVPASR